MDSIKGAVRSKTMWFAYVLTVLGVVETQFELIKHYIPEEYRGLTYVAIGVAVAVLRTITTRPLTER